MFGTETPFHLRPLPYRGIRKLEMEQRQHYPNYVHPMLPEPGNSAYISEIHRLHPTLTVEDELKHEWQIHKEKQLNILQTRRMREAARRFNLMRRREEEFAISQQRACNLMNSNRTNAESNDRDVITHQCRTNAAQQEQELANSKAKHNYYARQALIDARMHPTGMNIITWQPRRSVFVPPLPTDNASKITPQPQQRQQQKEQ